MNITAYEKNQIQLIDEQVLLLQQREACDEAIMSALVEFVPETVCLIENMPQNELRLYLSRYSGYAYFISIIDLD